MRTKFFSMMLGLALIGSAFVIPTAAAARPVVVVTADYQPVYYNGSLVFFDDNGRPFIVVDDQVVYIPAGTMAYWTYVRHFQIHHARYQQWYRTEGIRYRHPASHRPAAQPSAPARSRAPVAHNGRSDNHRGQVARPPARSPQPKASRPSAPSRSKAPAHKAPARAPSRGHRGR